MVLCSARLPCFFVQALAPTGVYTLPYTTLFRSPARRLGKRRRQSVGSRRSSRSEVPRVGDMPLSGAKAGEDIRDQIGRAPRLNSSHEWISYAVCCLKKKKMK